MSKFVKEHKPNLMFIHFLSIDEAGHTHSWGSPQYYQAVKVYMYIRSSVSEYMKEIKCPCASIRMYIGEIMQAFEDAEIYDETLFILTADHGG